ncbi:MAG TPA: hypothetical protein VFK32_07135 [Tepidiformaceae bacterium]|nr:hypothetical protein [Tepidiformaceae bacterium]
MTVREQLLDVIDKMSDDEIADLLDRILLQSDPDELDPDELEEIKRIDAEMAAGDYVTLDDFRSSQRG